MPLQSDPFSLLFGYGIFTSGLDDARAEPGRARSASDIRRHLTWAKRAEEATLDGAFFADFVGLNRSWLARGPVFPFDPFTQAAAASTVTEHLGLVVTASTLFNFPYDVARRLSGLDNAAPGRLGWNVVTSFSGERNFGIERIPSPEERYAQAEEFLEVVQRLWSSWPPAVRQKHRTGLPVAAEYVDAALIRDIEHSGRYYRVEGAIDLPPASAEPPVVFQAGASAPGLAFAARHAEAIFVATRTLADAAAFDHRLRAELGAAGRERRRLRVLPGLSLVTAATDAEAAERNARPRSDAELLALWQGLRAEVELLQTAQYELDEILPRNWFPSAEQIATSSRRRSRSEIYRQIADGGPRTLRAYLEQLSRHGAHAKFVGSVGTIVDEFERWFQAGHVDGFVLSTVNDIDVLLGEIVPALQERGVLKRRYRGSDLRANLGLV